MTAPLVSCSVQRAAACSRPQQRAARRTSGRATRGRLVVHATDLDFTELSAVVAVAVSIGSATFFAGSLSKGLKNQETASQTLATALTEQRKELLGGQEKLATALTTALAEQRKELATGQSEQRKELLGGQEKLAAALTTALAEQRKELATGQSEQRKELLAALAEAEERAAARQEPMVELVRQAISALATVRNNAQPLQNPPRTFRQQQEEAEASSGSDS